jgi:hypothetical protein
MEQMIERMLAKMDYFQEEMKVNQAKMDSNHAEMLTRMETKTDVTLKETIAEIWAW